MASQALTHQARFAQPSLAGQQHDSAFALGETRQQKMEVPISRTRPVHGNWMSVVD
jgi:hypothetical protein